MPDVLSVERPVKRRKHPLAILDRTAYYLNVHPVSQRLFAICCIASPAGIPAGAIIQVVIVCRNYQRPANCSQLFRWRGKFLRLAFKSPANCAQETLASIAVLNPRAGVLGSNIQQLLGFARARMLDAGLFLQ